MKTQREFLAKKISIIARNETNLHYWQFAQLLPQALNLAYLFVAILVIPGLEMKVDMMTASKSVLWRYYLLWIEQKLTC